MAFVSASFGWAERVEAASDAIADDLRGSIPRVGAVSVTVDRAASQVVAVVSGVPDGRRAGAWTSARCLAPVWPELIGDGEDVSLRLVVDRVSLVAPCELMWGVSEGAVTTSTWWGLVAIDIGREHLTA